MTLEQQAQYNQLSPSLRETLEKRIDSFGKTVTYKFDISHPDPHPDNRGKPVWPSVWTLKPIVFKIKDDQEERTKDGYQKMKTVGLIERITSQTEKDNGENDRFERIRLTDKNAGKVTLNLDLEDDRQRAMYIELHPKLKGGLFSDSTKRQIVERVDEKKASEESRKNRSEKMKAWNIAQEMSDAKIKEFADAMLWDSTEDVGVLREKVEDLAEATPKFFSDLIEGKSVEYRATVKQAMDKKLIAFDPSEHRFIWNDNNQTISKLQFSPDKPEVEAMAEWLMTGGEQAKKAYDKIKSLIKS